MNIPSSEDYEVILTGTSRTKLYKFLDKEEGVSLESQLTSNLQKMMAASSFKGHKKSKTIRLESVSSSWT